MVFAAPLIKEFMASEFFQPIRDILNGIISLDIDLVAQEIARTNDFKKLVITLNTEGQPTSQLFSLGEDATGRNLKSIGGDYSPFTKIEKARKGQPTDRVTLKDEGDFYRSFNVIPFKGGFTIEADTFKDGQDLQDRWGDNILGLNDENINIIINFYINAIQEKINQRI